MTLRLDHAFLPAFPIAFDHGFSDKHERVSLYSMLTCLSSTISP